MIRHNIFIMSHSLQPTTQTVVKGVITSILGDFRTALVTIQAQNKLPTYIHSQHDSLVNATIYSARRPLPTPQHAEKPVNKDHQPAPPSEPLLLSKGKVISKQQVQTFTQSAREFYPVQKTPTSHNRYSSSNKVHRKSVHLDLASIKPDQPICPSEPPQSVPTTALSRRAQAELDKTIRSMRYTYLKSLQQKAKSRLQEAKSIEQLSPKKVYLPKEFTHDYNSTLLKQHSVERRYTVRSPLRMKEVSKGRMVRQSSMNATQNEEVMSVFGELNRAKTGSAEKKVRVYNNASRRQVSHLPYIALTDNAKIMQNDMIISGQTSPKGLNSPEQRTKGSTFTSFYHPTPNSSPSTNPLHTQQAQLSLPNNSNPASNPQNGSIFKNSRLFKDLQTSRQIPVVDYSPANVPRSHPIDRYYKLRAAEVVE